MPTVIAIEAKPVEFEGVNSGFLHLYLVKTVMDDQGQVVSEKVIRGTAGLGGDLETLADANLATSPDRRGSDTPAERHRTVLDLGTKDPNDVWNIMVQHANNIEKAHLNYSVDIFRQAPGGDLNSNSVVASVLHSAGLSLNSSLPDGVSRSDVPLYGQLQYMKVNDVLVGTAHNDRIMGGVGYDRLDGGLGSDRLYGEDGNDGLNGGDGNDALYGGGGNDSLLGRAGNDILYGDSGNDRLYGSFGNDVIKGGSGDDRLYGQSGSDILSGNSGKDAFVFSSVPVSTADIDTIRDFSVADDKLWLSNSAFTGLGREGYLTSSAFWTGTQAHDTTDRVIYDKGHGVLLYDSDGTGAASQVVVAKLSAGLKMNHFDILVV